jgi:hypothetical protein
MKIRWRFFFYFAYFFTSPTTQIVTVINKLINSELRYVADIFIDFFFFANTIPLVIDG